MNSQKKPTKLKKCNQPYCDFFNKQRDIAIKYIQEFKDKQKEQIANQKDSSIKEHTKTEEIPAKNIKIADLPKNKAILLFCELEEGRRRPQDNQKLQNPYSNSNGMNQH